MTFRSADRFGRRVYLVLDRVDAVVAPRPQTVGVTKIAVGGDWLELELTPSESERFLSVFDEFRKERDRDQGDWMDELGTQA